MVVLWSRCIVDRDDLDLHLSGSRGQRAIADGVFEREVSVKVVSRDEREHAGARIERERTYPRGRRVEHYLHLSGIECVIYVDVVRKQIRCVEGQNGVFEGGEVRAIIMHSDRRVVHFQHIDRDRRGVRNQSPRRVCGGVGKRIRAEIVGVWLVGQHRTGLNHGAIARRCVYREGQRVRFGVASPIDEIDGNR